MIPGRLGPDALRAAVPPMEPVPVDPPGPRPDPSHPLLDPARAFQVKWDGVRMLAFLDRGRVRLQNRRLRDRSGCYPELAGLASLVAAREAVLDGEVVVLEDGRPSFPRVLRREQARGEAARRLAALLPATYAAFDLLYLDGEDLTGHPWWARQEMLGRRLREGSPLLHRTRSHDDGLALFAAVAERGLEGVVAKVRTGAYLPGRRSRLWIKVKVRRRIECVVGGYTLAPASPLPAALLVGLYGDGPLPAGAAPGRAAGPRLVYVGRVGSGLDEATRAALGRRLPEWHRPEPPFSPPPRLPGLVCRWVEPVLTAVVAFSEWTEDLRLRAPSLVSFGRAEPESCRF